LTQTVKKDSLAKTHTPVYYACNARFLLHDNKGFVTQTKQLFVNKRAKLEQLDIKRTASKKIVTQLLCRRNKRHAYCSIVAQQYYQIEVNNYFCAVKML